MLAASPLAVIGPRVAARDSAIDPDPVTFVLVHGAWHGGWCWKKVLPLLRAAGHDVFAPTLTGLGERSHLLSQAIGLDTHVQDVALLLEYEDLENVILVGHSYGGMLLPAVAEAAPDRVAQLVYLDAFLPQDGKALADYAPISPTRDDGWRIPSPAPIQGFGVTNQADVEWAQPRLDDQPLPTFTQPAEFSESVHAAQTRTYIRCSGAPWFVEAASRAQQGGFQYYELLSAEHDAMITKPNELAEILVALV